MAKQRNGDVRAAFLDLESSMSRVRQAFSDFLPSLTPSYSYVNNRNETFTGSSKGAFQSDTRTASITARWLLMDSGERDWSYRSARRSAEATRAGTQGAVRNILFAIYQRFYDAIRADELLRVAEAQVERAKTTLDATKLQIEVGAAPKKDELQAQADHLNARVSQLQAQNFQATASSDLKAIIGWDSANPLPMLEQPEAPSEFPEVPPLAELVQEGLANRPELVALRKRVEAQDFNRRIAERNATISFSVNAAYDRNFSPLVDDSRTLSFFASMPLFDGGFAKESARQARLAVDILRAQLSQSERDAVADIEVARTVLAQDVLRVQAAKLALDAAKLNYQAASESQKAGAEGTSILTVLTAQVSLVTAESNYVEALFDFFVSEARLRLATGRPLPGEDSVLKK